MFTVDPFTCHWIHNWLSQVVVNINGHHQQLHCNYWMVHIHWFWQIIGSADLHGSDARKVIEFGISQPEGLAVDWIAHNLYWTDFGRGCVEMSQLNGRSRLVLAWQDIRPRAIAVDPVNGSVFLYLALVRYAIAPFFIFNYIVWLVNKERRYS